MSSAPRLWPRLFALVYDPSLSLGELFGLRRRRRLLLAAARGRVVEVGAGTGLNVRHYPDGVEELILTEPEPAMRRRLSRRLRRAGRAAQVVDAVAERLPFADHSVDTVVATFVLCTVEHPERALREIARVLRPDGELLFVEHVRADSPRLARWQDRLAGPWQRFACGCHCNRSTVELMRVCGFAPDAAEAAWRAMPWIVRPLAIGRARSRIEDGDPAEAGRAAGRKPRKTPARPTERPRVRHDGGREVPGPSR